MGIDGKSYFDPSLDIPQEVFDHIVDTDNPHDSAEYCINVEAGETIPKSSVVYTQNDGKAYVADPENFDSMNKVIGIATDNYNIGDTAKVLSAGDYVDTNFVVSAGDALFFNQSGQITDIKPSTGYIQQVGIAHSTDTILIQLNLPTYLAAPLATTTHMVLKNTSLVDGEDPWREMNKKSYKYHGTEGILDTAIISCGSPDSGALPGSIEVNGVNVTVPSFPEIENRINFINPIYPGDTINLLWQEGSNGDATGVELVLRTSHDKYKYVQPLLPEDDGIVFAGFLRTTATNLSYSIVASPSVFSWDMGDSNQVINNNTVNYTYIDGAPSHNVSYIAGDPADITEVNVSGNEVSDIDLTGLVNTTTIDASNNELSDIDLSDALSLDFLNLNNNSLSSLNVLGNTTITELNANNNSLSSVNVSNALGLKKVSLSENGLSSMDFSNNTVIEEIVLDDNLPLFSLDINGLNTITVFKATNTNIGNLPAITANSNMDTLYVGNSGMTNIAAYLFSFAVLKNLGAENLNLSSIDLSSNILLEKLYLSSNILTELNITPTPLLSEVDVYNNLLTSDQIDSILTTLDNNGITGGYLRYDQNPGNDSNQLQAITAYNNLISKGWTVIGAIPDGATTLFTTTTQSSLDYTVATSGNQASWNFRDGNILIGSNSVSHVYTDLLPSHDVGVFDISTSTLTEFNGFNQSITNFDISVVPNLEVLNIQDNLLTGPYSFSLLPNLYDLRLSNNTGFGNVTTSSIPNLTTLYLNNTGATIIDVTNNPSLRVLFVGENPLISTTIDVSNNPDLEIFGAGTSNLTSMDFSNNPVLKQVNFQQSFGMTSLDLSSNPDIIIARINQCSFQSPAIDDILITLDGHGKINGTLDYSDNPGNDSLTLTARTAYDNLIAKGWTIIGAVPRVALDNIIRTASQNTVSFTIQTSDASTVSWDMGDSTTIANDNSPTHTYVDGEPFHDVDIITENPQLITYINLNNDDITEIDLTDFILLEQLYLSQNDISALAIPTTTLTTLIADRNNLTALNTANLFNLTELNVGTNNISSLNTTGLVNMVRLATYNNTAISSLDLSNMPNLEWLRAWNMNLTTLDVTNNTNLEVLVFRDNPISTIDISNNPALTRLETFNSSLSALDISNNPLLKTVYLDRCNLDYQTIDDVLLNLDNSGVLNGVLRYYDNPGEENLTNITSYNNLIAKGWIINGKEPSAVITNLLTTSSAGNVSPEVTTSTTDLASWLWGDGSTTISNNAPLHTYTDGAPSHNIDMFGLNPDEIISLDVTQDDITNMDLSSLVNLQSLTAVFNLLSSSVDLSNNLALQELRLGASNIPSLDISLLTALTVLRINSNPVSSIDVSNNTLLTDVKIESSGHTYGSIDKVLVDLDSNGQVNGELNYSSNPGESSITAITSYNSLVSKGWFITGLAPATQFLFATESQGTINPTIATTNGSTVSWDWGDNSNDVANNSPTHTYTDLAPTHNVSLYDYDPLLVGAIEAGVQDITSIDLSRFQNLQKLWIGNNTNLSVIDLSGQDSAIFDHLEAASTGISGVLDVSRFFNMVVLTVGYTDITSVLLPTSNMWRLRLDGCPFMTDVDLINLTNLAEVYLDNSAYTSSTIDKVLIDLDSHGRLNGYLNYNNNPGLPTNSSYNAYQSLISKGWTIVGTPPPGQTFPYTLPITFTA